MILLSCKYNIPPLLEQAAEKYSQAATIDPDSIVCLVKWGSALSRCALSRFLLDLEYSESIFEVADTKFLEADTIFQNSFSPSPIHASTDGVRWRSSSLISRRTPTADAERKPITDSQATIKIFKSSTPRGRAPGSADRTREELQQWKIIFLMEWAKALRRRH